MCPVLLGLGNLMGMVLTGEPGVRNSMQSEIKVLSPNGSIVNAASICGLQGRKGSSAYCASKHAVIGLSRAAAKEVATTQRINCIAP